MIGFHGKVRFVCLVAWMGNFARVTYVEKSSWMSSIDSRLTATVDVGYDSKKG